jgi:hypothetical protein
LPNQPTSLVPALSRFPRMRLERPFEGTTTFRRFCDSQGERLSTSCFVLGFKLRGKAVGQVGTPPVLRGAPREAFSRVLREILVFAHHRQRDERDHANRSEARFHAASGAQREPARVRVIGVWHAVYPLVGPSGPGAPPVSGVRKEAGASVLYCGRLRSGSLACPKLSTRFRNRTVRHLPQFPVFRRPSQGCFVSCLTEKNLHCTTFAVGPKSRLDFGNPNSASLRPNRKGGICDYQGSVGRTR